MMSTIRRSGRSAVLVTALMAAVTFLPAAPATAAADGDFEITYTWETLQMPNRDGCWPTGKMTKPTRFSGPAMIYDCGEWEWINASMAIEGRTYVTPQGQSWSDRVRNLGTWNRKPRTWDRVENWSSTTDPDFPAFIGKSSKYFLRDRPLCRTDTYKRCAANVFTKNSNSVKVRGKFGDKVRLGIHIQSVANLHSKTRDKPIECLMADYFTWTKANVEKHLTTSTARKGMLSTSDSDGRTLCLVEFTAVAKKL